LPALPGAWPDGRIKGLRARGGYTVNQEWKDGRLVKASIKPEFSGTLKIRYKDKTKTVNLKSGRTYRITFNVPGEI
jgi:alpha-L-fucosidase 2